MMTSGDVDADLRARILWALAARGEPRDTDIDALPELDPDGVLPVWRLPVRAPAVAVYDFYGYGR